jgi:hypothetical protein
MVNQEKWSVVISRLRAVILILLSALSLAACSSAACRTDSPPVYPDSDRPVSEPREGIQK